MSDLNAMTSPSDVFAHLLYTLGKKFAGGQLSVERASRLLANISVRSEYTAPPELSAVIEEMASWLEILRRGQCSEATVRRAFGALGLRVLVA